MEAQNEAGAFAYNARQTSQDLGGGVRRKIMSYGSALMGVEVQFEAGARGELHRHPHTQLTYVLEGEFRFTVGDETGIVRKGDTVYMPPDISHGCVCLKAGKLLDLFHPMRQDFLKK